MGGPKELTSMEQDLEAGNMLVWQECISSTCKHKAAEVIHDGSSLQVEVAEHFVRLPTPKQMDDVTANLGTKEGVGTSSTQTMCRHVSGEKPKAGTKEGDSLAKCCGDEGWCDRMNSLIRSKGTCKRYSWQSLLEHR